MSSSELSVQYQRAVWSDSVINTLLELQASYKVLDKINGNLSMAILYRLKYYFVVGCAVGQDHFERRECSPGLQINEH